MNKFKITPKIALIVVLAAICFAGIYLYVRNSNNTRNNVGNEEDRGFLSFFGERKVKPVDETTVPGVTPGQDAGSGTGTAGVTAGTDTGAGSGDVGGTQGNLLLRSIGSNSLVNTGSSVGSTSLGGTGGTTGIGTGGGSGFTTGGSGSGGTGGTGNVDGDTIPQIDCTPPQLPYNAEEIAKLKVLTERFYRIAANLHTDVDVENERATRKSYFDLYNQTIDYTNQCYNQLKSTDSNSNVAKESSARWHPYLTNTVLKRISKYDPRVSFAASNAKAALEAEIAFTEVRITKLQQEYDFLESLKITTTLVGNVLYVTNNGVGNLNPDQIIKLGVVTSELNQLKAELAAKKSQLSSATFLNSAAVNTEPDVVGTFFLETEKYKDLQLLVSRQNDNARRGKLWNYTSKAIEDSGNADPKIMGPIFTPNSDSAKKYNPLQSLLIEKFNPILNTGVPENGHYTSKMHRFRMLEDGLRIW